MERRVLLAIFLAFIVLYAWQALFVKPVPKGLPAQTPTSSSPALAGGAAPAGGAALPAATPAELAKPAAPLAAALVSDTAEREVRVETRDIIATFTNKGARLKSWRLKHYLDQQKEPQELIEHLPSHPLPFTLRTGSDVATATANDALYTVSGAPTGASDSAPVDLRFEYRDSGGIHVVKEFHLEPASYIFSFRGQVTENNRAVPATIVWGPAVGDITELSRGVKKPEGILFQNGKVVRLATKDIAKQSTYEGDFHYAGVDDNCFLVASLAEQPMKVTYSPVTVPPPTGSKDAPRDLTSFSVEPGHLDAP